MTPLDLAGLMALSGIAATDAAAAFQVMAGQPIVCGWIAGGLIGQPAVGLWIGTALQLFWSRLAPVGATAYPDVGPATVAGVMTAGAFLSGSDAWHPVPGAFLPPSAFGPAVLVGLLTALVFGRFGQFLTVAERRGNARLAMAADRAAASGSFAGVERANAAGIARSFIRGVAVVLPVAAVVVLFGRGAPDLLEALASAGPGTAGLTAFWWFGLAALATVLFRGGRADWLVLVSGLLFGGLARRLFF